MRDTREYDWNSCGVCLNPTTSTFKCDQGSFQVRTASTSTAKNGVIWLCGYDVNLTTCGMASPVSKHDTRSFPTETAARNMAIRHIKSYLSNKPSTDKLMREANNMLNVQLELF